MYDPSLPSSRCGISKFALGLVIVCISISACGRPSNASGPPVYRVDAEGEGNELRLSQADETTVIEVHSESGIGKGTVRLTSGTPPKSIVLRLYLRGLEQFQLSYNNTVVRASVASSDGGRMTQSLVSNGNEQQISASSPFWMEIKIVTEQDPPVIPLDQGYFEITLPQDYLQNSQRPFSIEWIDFFR